MRWDGWVDGCVLLDFLFFLRWTKKAGYELIHLFLTCSLFCI